VDLFGFVTPEIVVVRLPGPNCSGYLDWLGLLIVLFLYLDFISSIYFVLVEC
jgi:hypothetical protein